MTKNNNDIKVEKIISILKFLLTMEDLEIIRSGIEGVIENLEELSDK